MKIHQTVVELWPKQKNLTHTHTHTHTHTRTDGHCATILISPLQVPLLRVDKKEIEATTLASLTLRQGVLASI